MRSLKLNILWNFYFIFIIFFIFNLFFRLEGNLVETALALNKPVVNIQWLSDILLGAKIGLKNPKNIKYQQFDLPNPFLVNYDMVPHLMGMLLI